MLSLRAQMVFFVNLYMDNAGKEKTEAMVYLAPCKILTLLIVQLSVCALLQNNIATAATGYSAYNDWKNWARLRFGTEAGLASSYDRSGENLDYNQYEYPLGLITDANTAIVKTISGPGIIYRFWMPHLTANRNFPVRMFFDGEESPRLDSNSVDILTGDFNYFSSPLVQTCAGVRVCYEPIPFAQYLRIETENKPLPDSGYSPNRHYYQYSYLTYPPGTPIDSYTGTLTTTEQNARADMVALFENVAIHPAGASPTAVSITTSASTIPAEDCLILADVTGPGLVRQLNLRMDDANDTDLLGLQLQVFYDGQTQAAIDVPVAYYFGAGAGRAPYRSLPLGTAPPDPPEPNDGFYCYWPMPFNHSILVRLLNVTASAIDIDAAKVEYEPGPNDGDMCYLHAFMNTSIRSDQQIYHTMLSTTGTGHYVGNLLYLEQDSYSFEMLEGDEYITVDGYNILNGTGLEDAYNGGFYYNWVGIQNDEPEGPTPQSATRPLSGILYVHREEGVALARADQYRWQIADCLPFRRSLEVKIENQYALTGSRWTSVAFWYQLPFLHEDFDKDFDVDFQDFCRLAQHWGATNCSDPNWCAGTDLDRNEIIDLADLNTFVEVWLDRGH